MTDSEVWQRRATVCIIVSLRQEIKGTEENEQKTLQI